MTTEEGHAPRLVRDFPPLFYLESVDSTNSFLKDWSRKKILLSGTGVYAGNQTGGRGRRGNRWLHAPGNLALSVWVGDQEPPPSLPWTLRLAWTLLFFLRSRSVSCQLKYPNDIYLSSDSRKLAGILVEKTSGGSVLGVGLNRFLPEGFSGASAWEDLPDHHILALSLTELFTSHFLGPSDKSVIPDDILNDLNRILLWKGEWVAWKEEGQFSTGLGKIVGLDSSGRLLVQDTRGDNRTLPETIRSVERVEPSARAAR